MGIFLLVLLLILLIAAVAGGGGYTYRRYYPGYSDADVVEDRGSPVAVIAILAVIVLLVVLLWIGFSSHAFMPSNSGPGTNQQPGTTVTQPANPGPTGNPTRSP